LYQIDLEDIQHSLFSIPALQDKFDAYLISHAVFYRVCAVRRLSYSFTVSTHALP